MNTPLVEIIVIGSEILAGDVLDTNSHWLCREFVSRGLRVARMATLPDDPGVIGEALLASLARRPVLILTCGGLGPTIDDLTLAAIGAALGRSLAQDAAAYAMVQNLYAALYERGEVTTPEMTPARTKMSVLPAGSEPLANSVGAAPGVLMTEGSILIASLPGVPAEMKAIFEQSLWPRLAAQQSSQAFAERLIRTDCWDESIMAPAVDAVAARHPQVYVKSRAQVYGGGLADFVTVAARAGTTAQAEMLIEAAERDLERELARVGVHVLDVESALQ